MNKLVTLGNNPKKTKKPNKYNYNQCSPIQPQKRLYFIRTSGVLLHFLKLVSSSSSPPAECRAEGTISAANPCFNSLGFRVQSSHHEGGALAHSISRRGGQKGTQGRCGEGFGGRKRKWRSKISLMDSLSTSVPYLIRGKEIRR